MPTKVPPVECRQCPEVHGRDRPSSRSFRTSRRCRRAARRRSRIACAPRRSTSSSGHEQLLGPGKPLRAAIESGSISSMVLWGPPGCGKTTLARLLARYTDKEFVNFSAVTEGVPRVREIIREAEQRRRVEGTRHDSLLRRDPSLQSRAAGCVPAVGRSRRDHADRRDDREPVVRAQLRAPVAAARVRARAAVAPTRSARS